EQRLLRLISENIRVRPERLGDGVSLLHDLGVAGMDGEELMEAIARTFTVDLRGFDWVEYFGPEQAFNPFVYFWRWYRDGRSPTASIPRLEVRHLKQIVHDGYWSPPGS